MLPSPQVKLFRHGNRGEDSPDEGKIKVVPFRKAQTDLLL